MAEKAFPDDLRVAQVRLHQASSELAALCRTLPWSVEPMPGWEGEAHPHTGVVTGGRQDSPGWTGEQREAVDRLRAECVALSLTVTTHPYWAGVEREKVVDERMRLKADTKPAAIPALNVDVAA
ncbi:hypothetical protein ABZ208_17290 [Streptomyces sp. NPDC006208]|uniref:hypothetical protein n=1 Tax=Streptomyces sp. NPDC006208 TaxID=3156734 RepID=UPI0033B86B2B